MSPLLLRRGLILCGLCALLVLMWPVVKAGLASLYYFPAAYAVEQWQKSSDKPSAEQLHSAQQQIQLSLQWQPQNPHYQLMAAKIAEWAWFSGQLSTEAISKNEQIYQHAIAQRPSWPVAYADYGYFLATVQLRLADAWQQLELAEKYGAYLPEVHEKILLVAFSNWSALSVAQKATVFGRVAAAMGGPLQGNTIRLIKQYQLERQQCIYLRKKLAASAHWTDVQRQLCTAI
jgi:hypothetical protein